MLMTTTVTVYFCPFGVNETRVVQIYQHYKYDLGEISNNWIGIYSFELKMENGQR